MRMMGLFAEVLLLRRRETLQITIARTHGIRKTSQKRRDAVWDITDPKAQQFAILHWGGGTSGPSAE